MDRPFQRIQSGRRGWNPSPAVLLREGAQLPYAALQRLVARGGEIDAEGLAGVGFVRHKGVAGHHRHLVLLDRKGAEFGHVHPFGQVAPDEQAALYPVVGDPGRDQMLLNERQRLLRLGAVEGAQPLKMGLVVVLRHELVADDLGPDIGVHVLPLLADDHLLQQRLGRDCVADPHSGGDHLGEGAGVHHRALFIQGLDAGQILPRIPQVAVGVVLRDQDAVLLGERIHPAALVHTHGDAGRVLEIRDGVQELGVGVGLHRRLKHLYVDAVALQRHADQLGPERAEGVEGADEARRFAQHHVAGVDERLGQQLQRLLRAGGDQQVVKLPPHPVLLLHVRLEAVPQGGIPFGRAVL